MSYRFGWLRERSRSPTKGEKIRISGLSQDISEQKLSIVFANFGPVRDVRISTQESVDYKHTYTATVEMKHSQDAEKAVASLSKEGWKISFSKPNLTAENDDNLIWSGFLSRSKRHKTGTDIYLIKGNFELPTSVYHLDIPFRAPFPQDHSAIALLRIESSNNTQDDLFKTYIDYFSNKNRAGYIPIGKQAIYVIPYGEYALSLYPGLEPNQMLGVVTSASNLEDTE